MNLARFAIEKRTIVQFIAILLMLSGVASYFSMGKLEDPEFTLKTALVVTQYPGASPQQVEEEVTDVLETAVQQMESLDHVRSMSRRGLSVLYVDVVESKKKREMPQIWDDLRKKIADVQDQLPPGAGSSVVRDDFGDVYGVFLAVTGDGFSYAELEDYVDELRKELLLVNHVAKVDIWGEQTECVYVDISRSSMSDLGVPQAVVLNALSKQNLVVDAGYADVGRERLRFAVTGEFSSVEEIGDLLITGTGSDNSVWLKDIATIRHGYVEPAREVMRFNGQQALGLAISTVSGGNVIEMGEGVKSRLEELKEIIPVGIEVGVIALQSDSVQQSIDEFMLNLLEALAIVIGLLFVFMGWRSGLLIGAGLILTIAATFLVMSMMHIDLHRISLGALIIALGMLVDNAIVVTEGILVNMQRGMKSVEAAAKTITETAWPLLGATLVAVLAFLPVYVAKNNTGEYCESLFIVVGLSLSISWLLAMTVTPLWCHLWLKLGKGQADMADPYDGAMFRGYRRLLEVSLRHRLITIGLMVVLLITAVVNFKHVGKNFFPESIRPQLRVDYWLPEGSRIQSTSEDMARLEKALMANEDVEAVATFVGAGGSRFYLSLEPEFSNAGYGQIIINLKNPDALDSVLEYTRKVLHEGFPHAEARARKFPLGPSKKYEVEMRFRGPDMAVLRDLAEQAKQIMREEPTSKGVTDDWRQMVKVIQPQFSQARAQRVGLTREELGQTLKRSYDGVVIGLYREKNTKLPIIMRPPQEERKRVEDLAALEVYGSTSSNGVPLGQIVSDIKVVWEPSVIWHRDHQRTIVAQCDAKVGTPETLRVKLASKLQAIPLPPGYTAEWGGIFESSKKSGEYVFKGVPVSFLCMALIVVMLFNAYKQPLIIGAVLPLSLIGITAGLLLTGEPFGFLSLLGTLSLAGMLIKNAVILIDQTDMEIREGKEPYTAIVESAISRIRPVLMAAMSTVLGMTPLIFDKFWSSMAVTISFGLTFATVLTLIVVPVLYSLFFKIDPPKCQV